MDGADFSIGSLEWLDRVDFSVSCELLEEKSSVSNRMYFSLPLCTSLCDYRGLVLGSNTKQVRR